MILPSVLTPDGYLDYAVQQKTPVNVYLISGLKMQGTIVGHDNLGIVLLPDPSTKHAENQLIFKSAISTIAPRSQCREASQYTIHESYKKAKGTCNDAL